MAKKKALKYEWRDLWKSGLGPPSSQRLILYCLSDYMDENGNKCWPSQMGISGETDLSERSVRANIAKLKKAGWLKIKQKGYRNKYHKRNQYFPRIPGFIEKKKSEKVYV